MRIRIGRRAAMAVAVGTATLGAMALTAGGAQADAPPGGVEACPANSVCLYYNSPGAGWGSFENFSPGLRGLDLSLFKFSHWANGSGYGKVIYGDAASIVNNTNDYVKIYLVNQPYYVDFMPGYAGSLNDAWNNDKIMYT